MVEEHRSIGRVETEEERLAIMRRNPPPGPHVTYDLASVPPEVIERVVSEGTSPGIVGSPSPQRGRTQP